MPERRIECAWFIFILFLAYCVSLFSTSLFCFGSVITLCCPRPLFPKNKVVSLVARNSRGCLFLTWGVKDTAKDQVGISIASRHTHCQSDSGFWSLYFGKARPQTIPCDSSIQAADLSASLNSADAYAFRSVVGTVLYLARDRPDLLFTAKELSSSMSNPTLTAVARLRKLVGYLKTTSEFCMMLKMPVGGQGKLNWLVRASSPPPFHFLWIAYVEWIVCICFKGR